jgi:hypothetical protein
VNGEKTWFKFDMSEDIRPMANEPNSITTMKKYYNDRLHVDVHGDVQAEMFGGNDRSTIITLASHAESHLETQIGLCLPHLRKGEEKDWTETFRHDGPLGTFSACINMAFYLTMIDQTLRDQLHDLRDMRNAVAHTTRRVTFEDVELQNVAKRLIAPKGMFKLLENTADGVRRTFIAEAMLISSILIYGREAAIQRCRDSFTAKGLPVPF